MDRSLLYLVITCALPFIGVLVYNGVSDPLMDQKAWLRAELARADRGADDDDANGGTGEAWQQSIAERPTAWQPITAAPKAAEPEAPPAPEKPDIRKMLEGVRVTRSQIGARIKIITPQNERGDWYVVGDVINGCEIAAFDKTTVTFIYEWRAGNTTLEEVIERE